MATLAGSTIADTYDQLLALPSNGGNGTNLVALTDGNADTTFALSVATTSIAISATDKFYFDDGGNTYIHEAAADRLDFVVGGDTDGFVLKLDTTTKVGIGTAAPSGNLDITSTGTTTLYITTDGGDNSYVAFDDGGTIRGYLGWDESDSNIKLVTGTSFDGVTTGILLDTNGNVGIGTVAPENALDIWGRSGATNPILSLVRLESPESNIGANDGLGELRFKGQDASTTTESGAMITAQATGVWHADSNDKPTRLQFHTQSDGAGDGFTTANMVIGPEGNVGIGTTGPTSTLHVLRNLASGDTSTPVALIHQTNTGDDQYALSCVQDADTAYVAELKNTDADNPYGLLINYSGGAPDSTSDLFLKCVDTGATRCEIRADGDVATVDDSVLTSDRELKENIVDASSKLEDILKLKVRNFNFKSSYTKNTHKRIGFIAQEVEEVFPGLVRETLSPILAEEEAGIMRKEIKMSFVPMLVKAIQELSAKVTALENA